MSGFLNLELYFRPQQWYIMGVGKPCQKQSGSANFNGLLIDYLDIEVQPNFNYADRNHSWSKTYILMSYHTRDKHTNYQLLKRLKTFNVER